MAEAKATARAGAATIRPATAGDLPAIGGLWNEVIRDTAVTFNATEKTPADMTALLEDKARGGHALLVAEAAGIFAGFGTYGQFRGGIGYARTMEHTLMLTTTARGQGLGRALIEALADHARAGGAHSLFAGVSGENPSARDFHLACGFSEVAVLREVGWKFGRYMDLHLLQCLL